MFKYATGEEVQVGDRVGFDYANDRGIVQKGYVTKLFLPGSIDAADYSCQETGGILIQCDDGERQIWTEANENLILLEQSSDS